MEAFVAAGAGFLLAVLWFDLMFDVQLRGVAADDVDARDAAVDSIARYYRRVTTDARPMNLLVAAVMLATVVGVVVEIVDGRSPAWVPWASLVVAMVPIGLARARTVPFARRLGAASDDADERHRLASAVLRDHVLSFASIATLLALQLIAAVA